jgi:hydrogenase/urease accessory protein HupE
MTRTTAARWWLLAGLFGLVYLNAEAALAHDAGLDLSASFEQGFLHPVTGADHLIAMIAVGLLSGVLGGRAVVTVPALFVSFLLIGGVFASSPSSSSASSCGSSARCCSWVSYSPAPRGPAGT